MKHEAKVFIFRNLALFLVASSRREVGNAYVLFELENYLDDFIEYEARF